MTLRLLRLSSLLVSLLAGTSVAAQLPGPEGLWTGYWERDGSRLPVEMTFSHSASGYEGSFSSSQLQRIGIPVARVRYEAPSLLWDLVGDDTTIVFEGTLRSETLVGSFHEGTASGTFSLTRGTSTEAPVREDEVTFASGSVMLSGTIVSPAGAGPFPGIVFLHGSGAEGRWASRYLAHEFARRGVAALIYDKRGVGRSTGDWRAVGFLELVHDASAAVETLRSRPQVAPDRVGIYGHSQGGTIAPWVASENRNIAFVVAAAPSGVSMAEMEIYSLENDLNVRSLPATEKPLAKRYVRALVATAYKGAPRSQLDRVWEDVRGHSWALKPPPASDFYWSFSRRTAGYDPLDFWRRVTAPALLLYGEEDEREPPRRSAARIADAYLGAHGPRLDVIFFPLADHNYRLRQNATGSFAWPKTAPGYPERLIEWVLQAAKP
jgi:dienelactone hydrolase